MAETDPWAQFPVASGSPTGGTMTTLPSPPKPAPDREPKTTWRTLSGDEAKTRGLNPAGAYQVSSEGEVKQISEPKDKTPTEDAKASTISEFKRTLDAIDNAALLTAADNGWWETGKSGALVRQLPEVLQAGTDAKTLGGYIDTINANNAFKKLQEMRQNSPTGGAVGNVSDSDMKLLQSTISSINPDLNQPTFFANLATQKKAYLEVLSKLDPAAAQEYAKRKGIRFNPDGSAVLVSVDGEDNRKQEDPFGIMGGQNPPGGGGGGGTPGGGGDVSKLSALDGDQSGLAGLGTLATQGITLGLSDEASGVGGAIAAWLQGKDAGKAYADNRDAARLTIDRARQAHPYAGPVAEFLGGGAAAGAANTAATGLAGVVRQGAALGGIAGYGYGEGADSVPNAIVGAATGGVVGGGLYGIARGANAIASRRANVPVNTDVVQAGERQGIPVRQPDARPNLRGQYATAESGQTSGPIIREARAADTTAMEGRIADIGGHGNAADPYALGSSVQNAGQRYIAKTRQQADRLYKAAEDAAGGATVTARNADAVLDANIQELRAAGENSNAAAIKYLEGLRSDIDQGLSLKSVQNLRTNMRGQIGQQGLTGTDTERRVGQVIDAMTQDLAEQLPQEASHALKAADAFYRERQAFINDTLKQFMGSRGNPLSAETAASRLVSMTKGKGNYERFSRMWGQLDDAERADVSATVAASLGRTAKGEFSPAALIKSLDPQNGLNPRTTVLLFGRDGASALQDLRLLAQAKSDAMNRLSPSGQAISGAAGSVKTLMMSLLGLGTGGPAGAVAGGMGREFMSKWGEQRAARMLLNPDFTKWLRAAPRSTDPQVIDRYFSRLAAIPSIAANDNAAFVSAVRRAFGGPGAATAEDEQKPVDVPPQN